MTLDRTDVKKIYVASSWRNDLQPGVVELLRAAHFQVYDFKNPVEDDMGFHWTDVAVAMDGGSKLYEDWSATEYVRALSHPLAEEGFAKDFCAMEESDACVLLLPCGRSAHLEAGWFKGAGRPLCVMLDPAEVVPELMYKMADAIVLTPMELLAWLGVGSDGASS